METIEIYNELLKFDEVYIPFPIFDEANNAVIDNLNLYRQTGIANNLIITGESGTGKSSLCRLILAKHPRVRFVDRDQMTILYIAVPAAASIRGMAETMLESLGDPSPSTGTNVGKTNRIVTLCRNCGIELVLFDEAQHLYDRGKQTTHYLVGDWLKRLIDELAIPTVFLGLPRLELLLQANEQLRRRFSKRLRLTLGQTEGVKIESECLQLFMSLGSTLSLKLSSGDYSWLDLGLRLFYASDGRIAYIKKLMSSSLRIALENQDAAIDPVHLACAFSEDIWLQGIGALNPFNPNFQFRRLNRGGEPFESVGASSSRRE